jgi:fatty acid desaturase
MRNETTTRDLKDRLALIEAMITEGRRTTENWGWTFVLWGAAFYIAIAWATWGHTAWAWPVTMTAAVAVTVVLASIKGGS